LPSATNQATPDPFPAIFAAAPKENIMCAATKGGLSLADVDVTKEAVIQGRVLRGGNPVAGAYVRLLDSGGEFSLDRAVVAARGSVAEIDVDVEAV
jgi:hypothetical protein